MNSGRSVCEIGSVIGRMWRELGDMDKRPYFESFTDAKVQPVVVPHHYHHHHHHTTFIVRLLQTNVRT